ncbi:hypothetical protein UNDYM_4287 [Undibacterium sp. YM2]|uniref:AlbA family DNA-binding domain-containing protein n=1 Tax=Undibacterium sp. YM2 TaxID=2058625 RepID=UPI001331F117|nr:ATP-binding protein [Undibacterium sp. YM2]BBB68540.1 hypothetical protein UNDYM_4287 [Undibacterium sp. YM2]
MLPQLTSMIDMALLQSLCSDKCPESQTLEFKRCLRSTSEKDKQELAKDVTALANTEGGDIIYGIVEVNGVAGSLEHINAESNPPDSVVRRFIQTLEALVEPRIPGLKLHPIEVEGGYILLLRVPASFDGPHSIRINQARRFVMRNGTATIDMSYEQVRSAFDRTATLAKSAHDFIAGRLNLISEGRSAAKLLDGPLFVTHLVPISGLAGRKSVDLQEIYHNSFLNFVSADWGQSSRTFNFDGLLVHQPPNESGQHYIYNHIFRNGSMEGARLGGATRNYNGEQRALVWSVDMSNFFYNSFRTFLASAKNWGFSGPAVLSVAILNVKGYELGIGNNFLPFNPAIADRPHLITPEVWIADIASDDLDNLIRPVLDMLWQAFNFERCLDFDPASGAFRPRSN